MDDREVHGGERSAGFSKERSPAKTRLRMRTRGRSGEDEGLYSAQSESKTTSSLYLYVSLKQCALRGGAFLVLMTWGLEDHIYQTVPDIDCPPALDPIPFSLGVPENRHCRTRDEGRVMSEPGDFGSCRIEERHLSLQQRHQTQLILA